MNIEIITNIIIIYYSLLLVNTGVIKLIAQLFGIGAMVFLFLIYQQRSRKGMLLTKLSADICWVMHYLLLGAFAGLIPNAVGVFRELVFINRKDKKWASSVIWPIIFVIVNWTLGILSFGSWYDILPILASSFVTFSLWLDDPRLTKIITVPICIAFLTYDVFVGSYIGIVNELLSIISIVSFFIKNKGSKET